MGSAPAAFVVAGARGAALFRRSLLGHGRLPARPVRHASVGTAAGGLETLRPGLIPPLKIKTTRIAGGLLQPYKGLLPASV